MNEALVVFPSKRSRAPVVPAVDEAAKPGRLQHWRMETPSRARLVVTFSDGVVTLLRIEIWASAKVVEMASTRASEAWKNRMLHSC